MPARWRTPAVVIVAGCLIGLVSFGLRSTFGLFTEPLSVVRGFDRETFAFAIAVQNLVWGLGQPVAGAIADRYGSARVLTSGGLLYVLGTVLMAESTTGAQLALTAGVLIGLGLSGGVVHDRARRLRAAGARGAPLVGDGARHRCRVAGPVPVRAARAGVHRGLRRGHRARAAVGLRRARAGAGDGAARCARAPELPAADRRILRLRLPHRVRDHAPAAVPGGPRLQRLAGRLGR